MIQQTKLLLLITLVFSSLKVSQALYLPPSFSNMRILNEHNHRINPENLQEKHKLLLSGQQSIQKFKISNNAEENDVVIKVEQDKYQFQTNDKQKVLSMIKDKVLGTDTGSQKKMEEDFNNQKREFNVGLLMSNEAAMYFQKDALKDSTRYKDKEDIGNKGNIDNDED